MGMDIGARSCRLTSSRRRGITLELTPMSFWKSQESLCTPTGQGRGAMFQLQLTPPKRKGLPSSPAFMWLPEKQLLYFQGLILAEYHLPRNILPRLLQCLSTICYIFK